jgi:NTE family protein
VQDGTLGSVGVVATRMPSQADDAVQGAASGRSVLFLQEHSADGYAGDPARALDVVRGPLEPEHVLASSAIPVAFPPARITTPGRAAGWYIDGGVRLNTPLHPAVGLGATMIVLVSATSTTYRPPPPPQPVGSSPDIADAAAQVLNAALADRTTEDLAGLRRINRLVAQASRPGVPGPLTDASGRPYRHVDILAVSPSPGEMGRLAERIYRQRTAGLGRLSEIDNWLLGKALRGAGDGVGRRELLSYLFFDAAYFSAGIELGARSAAAALAGEA